MAKPGITEPPSVNIIGAGTFIEGDIKSDGDMRIDGSLNGLLNIKGKLVLGTTGIVDGEVSCQNADISGIINGKIKVTELLSLKATSKLTGDITTNIIQPGYILHIGTEKTMRKKKSLQVFISTPSVLEYIGSDVTSKLTGGFK